jgi:hypothetical protein
LRREFKKSLKRVYEYPKIIGRAYAERERAINGAEVEKAVSNAIEPIKPPAILFSACANGAYEIGFHCFTS